MSDQLRLVAYIRVSTAGQADDGLGLEVQELAILRWAERERHQVVEVMTDAGLSGTLPVEERPGLYRALAAARAGRADGVVVHRLDRLARVLAIQEAVLQSFWAADGRVFEVVSGEVLADDPQDPLRTAMRLMVGVFAQLERATIVARMRAGRILKAERGGYVGGAPGVGWRAQDGELVADDAEQATLVRLVELRASGLSLRTTGELLLAEGHQPKRASSWSPETVRRLEQRLLGDE